MSKTYETKEFGTKPYLQTHYYKCMEDDLFEYIPNMLESFDLKLLNINEEYKEITAYNDLYDVTFKIFMFKPGETSVDLFIDSRFLFDFGKTRKVILSMFNEIAKKYELLGLSLHKER